eukprot:sb/3475450/
MTYEIRFMLQYRIALKLRFNAILQHGGFGFPQIVKCADALDCRSGPLLDKVLWDYHINAFEFVPYEYDSYIDLTLDRLADLHLDDDCEASTEMMGLLTANAHYVKWCFPTSGSDCGLTPPMSTELF